MSSQRSVAIVGAGLGGLACARILQLRNIPVVVYEREASMSARQQGGSLDMHPDTGFAVLEMAQLADEFKKVARYEDQGIKLIGMDGTLHFDSEAGDHWDTEDDGNRPEVDRIQLRQIFLDALTPDTVKWGQGVSKVVEKDNKVTVHFIDSALEPAVHDFVVGADGAWSRVRPAISPAVPEYSGMIYIDNFIKDVQKKYPHLADFLKSGIALVLGDNKGLISQRNANDVVRVYSAFRKPTSWPEEVGLKALVDGGRWDEANQLLLKQYEGWNTPATGYFQVPPFSMDIRPLYALRHHSWDTNAHMTLVGDAHMVAPPNGVGANYAMLDGAELGVVIAENVSANEEEWLKAIKAYENKIQQRAWASQNEEFSFGLMISEGDSAARAAATLKQAFAAAAQK
ncbi:FAD-dependent monooxygenase [Favolaschia claudopus]|uniref:FAD-dependent monooxygenase n=1 Tax=Favolaschia claudopus TaxID=2862362 RepID=A0AAW0CFP3_9AGAR